LCRTRSRARIGILVNRWTFLSLLTLVTGVLAAFAIYTFGWRDSGGSDRDAVAAYARVIAPELDDDFVGARVVVDRIGGRLWSARVHKPGGGCMVLLVALRDGTPELDSMPAGRC
jgi:hypothetical protein